MALVCGSGLVGGCSIHAPCCGPPVCMSCLQSLTCSLTGVTVVPMVLWFSYGCHGSARPPPWMPPVCLMVSSCCPSTVGTRGALGPGHPLALRRAGVSLAGTHGSGHGQRAAESSQRVLGPGWPPLYLPAQLLWLSGSDCCPQWGKCLRCSLSPWRRWGGGHGAALGGGQVRVSTGVSGSSCLAPPPGQARGESLLALPLPPLGVGTPGLA